MIALMKVKISKISAYSKRPQPDPEIMKLLSNVKDPKQLESQKELLIIKETKKHIAEQLINIYLPGKISYSLCVLDGFSEMFNHIQSLGYYDRPDYDYLIKTLERAKDAIPFYAKMKNNSLVDQEV